MTQVTLVEDPLTGQPRLVAPARAARLGPRPDGCPFCPGNEHTTPRETDRINDDDGAWRARAFPNLYPLARTHEVLVPTRRHATSLRELSSEELRVAIELWVQRIAALQCGLAEQEHLHLFVNDGANAGASLEHTHAQIAVVPRTRYIEEVLGRCTDRGSCSVCALEQIDPELVISSTDQLVVVAASAPRMADTLLLAPRDHAAPLHASDELAAGLETMLQALPEHDFNLLLVHESSRNAHWYLECVPRWGQLAGLELGTGLSVSIADPLESAARARARLAARRSPA